METDVDKLRSALKEYNQTLDRHHSSLRHDFGEIDHLFHELFSVYGGQRADEMKASWQRTAEWFVEYLNSISGLRTHLEERSSYLEKL